MLGTRAVAGGLAATLIVAMVSSIPAGAVGAPTGVGASDGLLTVASATAGEILDVQLVTDFGAGNTDTELGDVEAATSLVAADISSLSGNIDVTVPDEPVQTKSTGAPDTVSLDTIEVNNPALTARIIPVELSSAVDADGARSLINTEIDQVNLLAGVATLEGGKAGLLAGAGSTSASSLRGVEVDQVAALNLAALLEGLGISLLDLTPEVLDGLIAQLDLDAELLDALLALPIGDASAADLPVTDGGLFDALDQLITDLEECIAENVSAAILIDLPGPCDELEEIVDLVLDVSLTVIGNTNLVTVDNLSVKVQTTAAGTVDESEATINAALGNINVAGVDLGGLDATSTLAEVNALADAANSQLSDVLELIDPSLAGIIDVRALEQVTDVSKDGNRVVSRAAIKVLAVDITVPEDLTGLLESLGGENSLGALLGLDPVDGPMGELNKALGGLFDGAGASTSAVGTEVETLALSEGVNITLGEVAQTSVFQVVPQLTDGGTPAGELPRTGHSTTIWLLFGGALLAAALGLRHWFSPVRN